MKFSTKAKPIFDSARGGGIGGTVRADRRGVGRGGRLRSVDESAVRPKRGDLDEY
jgi:hypothetical protein